MHERRIDNSIIMAHRNSDVSELNILARAKLIKSGTLKGEETVIKTNNGNLKILQGERVLFTKNDRSVGVKNGNFATVLNVSKDKLEVMMSGKDAPVSIDLRRYDNISYGYAATVHKLQGVTVDKSYVYYGGKYRNKNLNLVALSRHREDIKLFADTKTHRNYDILKQRLNRAEFKDSVLNYPVAFSLRYGIDPDSVMGKVLNKFNKVIEKVQDAWLWLSNKQSYLEKHPRIKAEGKQLIEKSHITQDGRLFISKEERMELLHLLRNMGRRYNVSGSSGKHSMYTEEYAKHDKLKEKISTKIDQILSNLKNREWINLIYPVQEEKQNRYKSDYMQPLTERLKPIIDSVKNNKLSIEQYQALAAQINRSIKTVEGIKTNIAEFQTKIHSKNRGISY